MKKTLALVLALVMCLMLAVPVLADDIAHPTVQAVNPLGTKEISIAGVGPVTATIIPIDTAYITVTSNGLVDSNYAWDITFLSYKQQGDSYVRVGLFITSAIDTGVTAGIDLGLNGRGSELFVGSSASKGVIRASVSNGWSVVYDAYFVYGTAADADAPDAAVVPADPTPADPVPTESTPAAPAVGVLVNGTAVQWTDAEPFIDENSRTMVPLRAVADALGLNVDWDNEAREAVFTDGAKTIYFPIDSTTARTSDGGALVMDTAAIIRNDRTYAPIRYLAEFFGHTVDWDNVNRNVVIN